MDSTVLIPVGMIATMSLISVGYDRSRSTTLPVGALLLIVCITALSCDSSSARFLDCASPIFVLVLAGLCTTSFIALLKNERAQSAPLLQKHWTGVCQVLGGEHEHFELAVRGTYGGHRVEALARHVIAEPGSPSVSASVFEVRLWSDPGGRQWLLQAKRQRAIVGRSDWKITTHSQDFRKRLEDGGIVTTLEAAIGSTAESDAKILYLPEDGLLSYEESSGTTTDADTIQRRLDILLSLDAINRQINQG